jgi:hypothetical protein
MGKLLLQEGLNGFSMCRESGKSKLFPHSIRSNLCLQPIDSYDWKQGFLAACSSQKVGESGLSYVSEPMTLTHEAGMLQAGHYIAMLWVWASKACPAAASGPFHCKIAKSCCG